MEYLFTQAIIETQMYSDRICLLELTSQDSRAHSESSQVKLGECSERINRDSQFLYWNLFHDCIMLKWGILIDTLYMSPGIYMKVMKPPAALRMPLLNVCD